MTSQKDQIQTLIAEIDSVLQRINPRLPWVMSGEVTLQRQVLERVRNYLVALQQRSPEDERFGASGAGRSNHDYSPPQSTYAGEQSDMTPYQMMQTILREVSYLRANLTPPGMNQQQLTAELLQVLMSRLQENLSQQIAQTLENLRNQSLPYSAPPMLPGSLPPTLATPQYEQLQSLRSRSDQMLVNLDSTLNIVFESLQRNIQSYQESLSHGVERMHSLGQQSELTFKALIEQLSQQLKQEASSYLLSSPQTLQTPASTPPSSSPAPPQPSTPQPSTPQPSAISPPKPTPPPNPAPSPLTAASPPVPPDPHYSFPYAGSEFSSVERTNSTPPAIDVTQPDAPLDTAIESWLQSISAMGQSERGAAVNSPEVDLPEVDLPEMSLPALDLSGLELGEIELGEVNPIADSSRVELPAIPPPPAPITAQPPDPLNLPIATDEDTASIDAALKLLEDLSTELDNSSASFSLEDAEAQLEQMLSGTPLTDDLAVPGFVQEDAQDELDEFYQSLFGEAEAQSAQTAATPIAATSDDALSLPQINAAPIATETPLFLELPTDLFADATTPDPIGLPPAATSAPEPDRISSLSDLFQTVKVEESRSVPADPPAVSGFGTAAASPPSPTADQLFLTDDLFSSKPVSNLAEDPYTRAAPEENLLPSANVNEVEFNFELDDLTLSSLNEDLSSLEGSLSSTHIEPAASPDFTLDSFAADVAQASLPPEPLPTRSTTPTPHPQTIASTVAPAPFYQASPAIEDITIEGFAELFDEPVTSRTASAIAPTEPLPFTLEGEPLFEPVSPSAQPTTSEPSPFTLEGMDDLFGDARPLPRPAAAPPSPPPPPPTTGPSPPQNLPFMLEGMDELFNPPAPNSGSSAPTQPRLVREIPPFKPELFTPDDAQLAPPFKLEQLDNLFSEGSNTQNTTAPPTDTPANHPSGNHPSGSNTPVNTPDTNTPDKQSLDAAFESLLGLSSETPNKSQVVQKKKKLT